MDNWIRPEDWQNGLHDLPKMKIATQNYIRSKKRIKYTKNGRNVIYKKQWILDYYAMNTSDVIAKVS